MPDQMFQAIRRTHRFAAFILTLAAACGGAEPEPNNEDTQNPGAQEETNPPGWSEASHTSKGDPEYAVVFPQDQVARLDITITATDWQAMQDDMTSLAGPAGSGMGGGMMPGGGGGMMPGGGTLPVEFTQACEGKMAGDACSATFMGNTFTSTCRSVMDKLACMPSMGGGGMGGGGMGGGNFFARDPKYVPCTVAFNGRQWNHVGIRYKGNSSLASAWGSGIGKLPLRLSFDQYEDDHPLTKNQRLWGFKDLSLSNGWGDDSLIREKVANDVFRAAGVPAPVAAFYRVYIDFGKGPTYFGLYTANDMPDSPMLKAQWKESKGNLYKPEGKNANWTAFDEASFEKKSNEDDKDWSDIQAAIAALNGSRADAAVWRKALDKAFNVDGFMRWLAVNTLIQNWDAYGMMAHNYYLYGVKAQSGQLQWIQWDTSLALQGGRGLSFDMKEVGASWPLIRYTMDDSEYRKAYEGHLAQAAADVFSEAAMTPRFRAANALVMPYVIGAEGEISGYTFLKDAAAFSRSVDTLIAHVQGRQQALKNR